MWDKSREQWQNPAQPVTSTRMFPGWHAIDKVVIHYTAAPDVPTDNPADIPQYLRNMQNYYVTQRGYSLGYSAMVDVWGTSWEIRGTDFRNAANSGSRHPNHNCNNYTLSILCLVDGQDPAPAEMVAEIRRIIGSIQLFKSVQVIGHQDLEYTSCPGVGLQAQVKAGVFYPSAEVGDMTMYSMKNRDKNNEGVHYGNGFQRTWVPDTVYNQMKLAGFEFKYLGSQPASVVQRLGKYTDL